MSIIALMRNFSSRASVMMSTIFSYQICDHVEAITNHKEWLDQPKQKRS